MNFLLVIEFLKISACIIPIIIAQTLIFLDRVQNLQYDKWQ